MDQKNLFEVPKMEPLPDNYDSFVSKVVVVDELSGGFGQKSQKLPEPIEMLIFENVEVRESMIPPEPVPVKLVSAKQGIRLAKQGFKKNMTHGRTTCRSCSNELPEGRSMYCEECRPPTDDPGQYLYCGVSGE